MTLASFFHEVHEEIQRQPNNAVFLYIVGKNYGKRMLGSKKPELKDAVNLFAKAGLGALHVESADEKKKEFRFVLKNSALKTELGRPTCNIASGILAAVIENRFHLYAGAMETKCVSQGDKHCEIHVHVVGKEPM